MKLLKWIGALITLAALVIFGLGKSNKAEEQRGKLKKKIKEIDKKKEKELEDIDKPVSFSDRIRNRNRDN